jgi:hypothetical protein
MKTLIMILLILVFFGCDPKDGEDGEDGSNHPDEGTSALVEIENPMGFAEAASCLKRGDVNLTAMDSEYKQLNDYSTTTKDDLGTYVIEADVLGIKARTSFRGYCFRETAEGYVYMSMDVYHDLADNMNVNIPGTIQGELSTYYKDDVDHPAYNNRELALEYAKDDVLNYFDLMGYSGVDFSIATIQGDTVNDAIMTIISSTVDSRHSTGPEMNDDMSTIAEGIYNNNLTLKGEIISDRNSLKIKDIKERVTKIAGSCPPIWGLDFVPDYYADIFDNSHDVLESFSMGSTSQCSFDTNGFNSFAYPIQFTSIENAAYFASELTGDLSIWSVGICNQGTNYDCPGTKIIDIEELNEILLEPELIYNGSLGSHSLMNGQYFVVQNFASPIQPGHACDSDLLPFGRVLAAVNNNWNAAIGWNNTTSWYNRAPKIFTTN